MPHVSKKKIPVKTLIKISDDLVLSILRARGKKDAGVFVRGLFTKTERIMLAKRLAAFLLLSRGVVAFRVAGALGLSHSTTRRFQVMVEYKNIAALVGKRGYRNAFDIVEQILLLGLPPRGKGRWRPFYDVA